MKTFISSFLLFSLVACSRSVAPAKQVSYGEMAFIAWNEDTVQSYKFILLKDSRFVYSIVQINKAGRPEKKSYSGKAIGYNDKYDIQKLHLLFDSNKRPDFCIDDLVVEGSENYLIQSFTDGRRRVFMRIDRLIRR